MRTLFLMLLGFLVSLQAAYIEELKWPKGETFLTFLEKHHLSPDIYYTLDKEDQELAAEIVAGVRYQVLRSEDQSLEQVLIPIGEEMQMHLRKEGSGYTMEIIPIIYQDEHLALSLEIQHSPHSDIIQATNNHTLANEFANSFRANVDLRSLQKGDKLVILYNQKRRLGRQIGSVKIDLSMIQTRNKPHYVFYYNENYYDIQGRELENFLLTTPVHYTRISSTFTNKRFHPILKRYRAHLGVDYAAPVGTPIRAAGDGKITFVGTKGGYGKTIEIQHDGVYKTLYGHMNGFAKGMSGGKRIKKGQLIGYVGNTGLSSGPHLHFGLYRSNTAINPSTVVKIAKSTLSGNALSAFKAHTQTLISKAKNAIDTPSSPVYEELGIWVSSVEEAPKA